MSNFTAEAFDTLWRGSGSVKAASASDMWDSLAEEWIAEFGVDGSGKPDMHIRAVKTAEYLRCRGLLRETELVADIGCGPGLFVAEFAKTAKLAVGLDYSHKFLEYGRVYTERKSLSNAEFRYCDFVNADLDAEGLAGAFDLAFTSITPVINSMASVEKLMKMSRAWCFNTGFVHTSDSLTEQISLDVFGKPLKPRRDHTVFFSLLNILLLLGYYPETTYYDEVRDEIIEPTYDNAARFADECKRGDEEGISMVWAWLEKQDSVIRHSEYRYGSVLWDVRVRHKRT